MVLLNHLHPRVSIATSPAYNHRRRSLHGVLLSMRSGLTRDLPLGNYNSASRQQQLTSLPISRVTKSENLVETSTEEKGKEEEDKKEEVSLPPPPPEKPEPGDCCGSGCVRCVWDVYSEELEEYNKLTKSN